MVPPRRAILALVLRRRGGIIATPSILRAQKREYHRRPDRPNILLITSDQQHWRTLGVNNPRIQTPALDRLCAEGVNFTRAYCPNPTCTPTRASMITGMYPSQHGAWSLGTKLFEDVPVVGDRLAEGGYRTVLIGKASSTSRSPATTPANRTPASTTRSGWRKTA